MRKLIGAMLAGRLLQIFWILMAVFHILLLMGILPMHIAWGGRIDASRRILYESIALLITVIFIAGISVKMHFIRLEKHSKTINTGIWIIFAYLIFNTVGNLASGVFTEKLVFAPLTLFMSVLAFQLAVE
jgi:hypothetical protein